MGKRHKGKIKVLLVANPKTDLGFDRAVRIPALGLSSIAANLDQAYCEVKVLDLVAAGRNPREYFQNVLMHYVPDVVGLSCMTFQYEEALALARITRSVNKDMLVVMGGYHPTVASDLILNNDSDMRSIDFLVRGEGEIAFDQFVKALSAGDDFTGVSNLSFIDNGKVIHTPGNELLDLDRIKPPDRDMRLIKKGFYLFGEPADVVETSRGCVFDCDFCSMQHMYGKSYRIYAIDRVLKDLMDAHSHGAKGIFVADDNITLDGKRYKELCEAIIDAGLSRLKFFVQASVRGLYRTPGLIEKMVKSGVRWIFLGIENISPENLEFLDKNDQFKTSEVFEVVAELRKRGVLVIGGFIIGNPDDTAETIKANYDYAKKLRIDAPIFLILTPFPKTAIREKLIGLGLVTNLDDFTRYTCFKANVRTKYLSSEQLYNIREEMGFRYPVDSGSIWRLAREFPKHPIHHLMHLGVGQFVKNPREVIGYLKGLFGKF